MLKALTVKQAAEQTGYSEYWVRKLLREGKLIGSKRKGQWLIVTSSLVNYLNNLPKGKRRGRPKKRASCE